LYPYSNIVQSELCIYSSSPSLIRQHLLQWKSVLIWDTDSLEEDRRIRLFVVRFVSLNLILCVVVCRSVLVHFLLATVLHVKQARFQMFWGSKILLSSSRESVSHIRTLFHWRRCCLIRERTSQQIIEGEFRCSGRVRKYAFESFFSDRNPLL
jgi:hypothetical protein